MRLKVIARNGGQTATYECESDVVPRVGEKLWLGDHQFEVADVAYYIGGVSSALEHIVIHAKYKASPQGTFETFKHWAKRLDG
ncbi:hypothetical protein [Alicyclobacillus acidiphilus]|uniref:hypothetical protein n=1 Tax=Alicyclobacillus acidiphilus TaxID=182455 RepID=UPI000A73441A|nr:hypothetical protein [Alicyclobacillus acidiphilus]